MLSVEIWKSICDWATVVLAALTFVALAGAVITGNVLAERQDKEIAQLKKEAGEANQKAGEAKERADALERNSAALKEEAERERLARVELENKVAWRRLTEAQQAEISRRLARSPSRALLWYNSNDIEANTFGLDIANTLHRAGWNVSEPTAMLKMREGPVRFGSNPTIETGVIISSVAQGSTHDAAQALV